MYLGYLHDRHILGYSTLKDKSCGIKLVLITDWAGTRIRELPLTVNGKSKVIFYFVVLLSFSNLEPAGAKDSYGLPGADGFSPPMTTPSHRSTGSGNKRSARGAIGQNPSGGGGGGNSNPDFGGGKAAKNCPNPKYTPKNPHHLSKYQLNIKKKQIQQSIAKEKQLKNKTTCVIIIDDLILFLPFEQLGKKFKHVKYFDVPIPEVVGDINTFQERNAGRMLEKQLPRESIYEFGNQIREHVLDPNTQKIWGTFGLNREKTDSIPRTEGYIFFNPKTDIAVVFNGTNNQFITGFKVNKKQRSEITNNNNLT